MDHTVTGKRSPLLLVGDAPAYLRAALGEGLVPADGAQNNFYFILFADSAGAFAGHAEGLLAAGVPADQILVAADAGAAAPEFLHALAGRVWVSAEASLEETRHELAAALVAQRHRKLASALESAGTRLNFAQLESLHLTHALCLAAELSPRAHSLTLQTMLAGDDLARPWDPAAPRERLLAAAAGLAQAHWAEPARFREAFRDAGAMLPLRVRTELRTLLERCLAGAGRVSA